MSFLLVWAMMVAGSGVMGDWVGPTGSVVRIEACGPQVCARLVKITADAPVKVDAHNPDPALRTRPLCGMNIGTGFRQVDPGKLEDGHLYDPVSGKTYKGTITADGDELKLHGYVGISMLGRTEKWKRIDPVQACR